MRQTALEDLLLNTMSIEFMWSILNHYDTFKLKEKIEVLCYYWLGYIMSTNHKSFVSCCGNTMCLLQ